MTYINLTPRWTEILPTWLMMYEQALSGDCTNPDLVNDNAKKEFRRMAEAADKFNDLVAWMKHSEGWSNETIQNALALGRSIQETERTTIKEG